MTAPMQAYFKEEDTTLSSFPREGARLASSCEVSGYDWVDQEGNEYDGRRHEFLEQFYNHSKSIRLSDGLWYIEKNTGVVRGKEKNWYLLCKNKTE
jgi:hypothetical protein